MGGAYILVFTQKWSKIGTLLQTDDKKAENEGKVQNSSHI